MRCVIYGGDESPPFQERRELQRLKPLTCGAIVVVAKASPRRASTTHKEAPAAEAVPHKDSRGF
jgi:hypothetical protein